MRFIFGLIVGAALTVGVAYLGDTMIGSASAKPLVNWDVVGQATGKVTTLATEQWNKYVK